MAVKNNLIPLMGKKQAEEGRVINASTVADETGLTRQAISKWTRQEITEFRGETVELLCKYFKCNIGDLLYIDWEQETSSQN